ncbi:MAG: sulfotransferase, partial [Bacteroidales bacterium]|nr:sulfotransferase [Bacteroidales bacterium]
YSHPNVHTLRYEDMVSDYENTMGKICSFLEIEFDNHMLNWYKHAKVRKNSAWFSDVKPLNKNSMGKWQRTRSWKEKRRIKRLMNSTEAIRLLKFFKYI